MDSQRVKDDDDAIRASLTSLKTATGIPVAMYGTLLADNRLQVTQWIGLRTLCRTWSSSRTTVSAAAS